MTKTQQDLLDDIVKYSLERADALEKGKPKQANKCYDRLIETMRNIRNHFSLKALLPLLNHESPSVRSFVAVYLLPEDEQLALEVLYEVSLGTPSIVRLNAEMCINEWKAGRLKPFYGAERKL